MVSISSQCSSSIRVKIFFCRISQDMTWGRKSKILNIDLKLCNFVGRLIQIQKNKIENPDFKQRNFVTNFGGPASNSDLAQPLILNPNLIRSHAAVHSSQLQCILIKCVFEQDDTLHSVVWNTCWNKWPYSEIAISSRESPSSAMCFKAYHNILKCVSVHITTYICTL